MARQTVSRRTTRTSTTRVSWNPQKAVRVLTGQNKPIAKINNRCPSCGKFMGKKR